MKTLKAILDIIIFAIEIFKGYKRAKNEKKGQEFIKAVRSGDTDFINQYLNPGRL